MLPQELDADVHELRRVQGAAACAGGLRRVGGDAVEAEADLAVGQGPERPDAGVVLGVPGEGRVQLVEDAVPGHEALA